MLSKVMFTLEGILGDIVGSDRAMGFALVRHVAQHWLANRSAFRSPLTTRDWFTLQCSALLYTSRLWVQWERAMLNRLPYTQVTPPAAPEERTTPNRNHARRLNACQLDGTASASRPARSRGSAGDALLGRLDKRPDHRCFRIEEVPHAFAGQGRHRQNCER